MNPELRAYLIQLMNVLGQMHHPGRDSKEVGMIMSVKDRSLLISEGWKLIKHADKMNTWLLKLRKEN